MEEWRYSSTILVLSTRDEWTASRPATLPQGKSPRYPLDRRLGGPQSQSGCCLPGIKSWPSSLYPITILSDLSWLLPTLFFLLFKFTRAKFPFTVSSHLYQRNVRNLYVIESSTKGCKNLGMFAVFSKHAPLLHCPIRHQNDRNVMTFH
jgi:hypothetical protein